MSAMGPGLRQELRQMLAPEMLQLLKLLQLPTLELQQLVRQELEINPLLDEVLEETQEEIQETEGLNSLDSFQKTSDEPEPEQPDRPDQLDWENYLQEGLDSGYYPANRDKSEEDSQPYVVTQQSFQDYILSQLRISCDSRNDLEIGNYLIGNLNDDGYLTMETAEVAAALHYPLEEVERVLALVQNFDPPGVAARNLRECLLIQLNNLGYRDSLAWKMVDQHLDDLERRRYQAIARALKATEEEVSAARDIISALFPKPGAGLGSDETRYIFPDILIEKQEGEYVIIINDRVVPRVRVTPDYKKILQRSKTAKPEERDYVVKRLEAARFIVRMIEQRRRTVQKIMLAIVDRQRDFLDHGLRHFRPLTMKQVADDIGMHESTVSRAVHNKYALTPHGLVAVRFFFGGGMSTSQGQDSVKAIKDRVLEMIKNEDLRSPLTDQDITDLLAKQGLKIARRTIAKYRQEGNIQPASIRKNP